ncbi:MAG: shikimate dehydrogenase [Lachnospiraceae bacterium]|nr:shikimate dehydrogenase [Lachnospiraceae bacterium]
MSDSVKRNALESNIAVSGKTRVCGLIGDPVEHTLSPLIHNSLAALMGIDMIYVPMRVESGSVDSAVRGAYDLGILGLNVTVPHKITVMDAALCIQKNAAVIGAVNTLVRDRENKGYVGYNTDYLGLKRALSDDGISLKDRNVVILGAGGAARAAAFLCAFERAGSVYILNRNTDKAEALCRDVDIELCKPLPLNAHSDLPGDDLTVIQASSVGLHPDTEDVIIDDESFYSRISYGFDLIYNPAETRFMRMVTAHGGRASNGLKMLLYQAVCAFELWNDVRVPADITDRVADILRAAAIPEAEDIR